MGVVVKDYLKMTLFYCVIQNFGRLSMEILEWVGWKFLSIVGIVTIIIAAIYGVLHWALVAMLLNYHLATITSLAITAITSMLVVIFFKDNLPYFYDDTEEYVIEEFIIHEEPNLFRITLVIGANLFFIIGIIMKLSWPAWIGLILGGNILWLFCVDIVMAVVISGFEGLEEITNALYSDHMKFILAIALCGLILMGVSSKRSTPVLPIIHPPVKQSKGQWEKFKDSLRAVQQSWQDSIHKLDQQKVEKQKKQLKKLTKGINSDKLKSWLQEVKAKEKKKKIRDALDTIIQHLSKKKK